MKKLNISSGGHLAFVALYLYTATIFLQLNYILYHSHKALFPVTHIHLYNFGFVYRQFSVNHTLFASVWREDIAIGTLLCFSIGVFWSTVHVLMTKDKVVFAFGEIDYCWCLVVSVRQCVEIETWRVPRALVNVCLSVALHSRATSTLPSNPAHDRVDGFLMDCYVQYPGIVMCFKILLCIISS